MTVNRCLICYTEIHPDLVAVNNQLLDIEYSSFLSKDLHVIFVLRNLFEVPYKRLQTYLTKDGNPSDWRFLTFCNGCGEAVANAKRIHQEIVEASRIFAAVKGEIVESVKRSWRRENKTNGARKSLNFKDLNQKSLSSWADEQMTDMIIDETRNFIFDHDYGPSSDPFPDGDLIANDLLCSPQSFEGNDEDFHDEDVDSFEESVAEILVKEEPGLLDLFSVPNDTEIEIKTSLEQPVLVSLLENTIKEQKSSLRRKIGRPIKTKNRPTTNNSMGLKNKFLRLKSSSNNNKIKLINGRQIRQEHKNVNTTEPFKCDFKGCGKVYATKGNLTQHQRRHRGETPFQMSMARLCLEIFKIGRSSSSL